VILPLALPAVSTVAVFSFLGAWDEYVLALNFLTDEPLRTLPIAIANFRGQHATNWGLVFAGSLTAVVPTVLLFIFFQRYFIQGLTSGAVRG
jgi:multiple sugar transport system permease protein